MLARASAAVWARAPEAAVVASSVASWMTAASSSAVTWMSISTHGAPARQAASNAAIVFCGATLELPRWAMTAGTELMCSA